MWGILDSIHAESSKTVTQGAGRGHGKWVVQASGIRRSWADHIKHDYISEKRDPGGAYTATQ